MYVATLALLAVAAVAGPVERGPLPMSGNVAVPENCLVSLIEEAQVPAQEPGVLVTLKVAEGAQVRKGDLLAQIDFSQVALQKKQAVADYNAAQEKSKNDVEVRFATAAAEVAKAEYDKAMIAESRVRGSIGEAELNRLKLTWKKAYLQIEQASIDRRISAFASESKAAEADGAENNIERRQITSPLDGIVVQVNGHVGEWVKPGDPVLHVIRIDRLRVEGWLSFDKHAPEEVDGRDVVVEVTHARGRKLSFPGKVVFVNPRVQAGGQYQIYATVDNRQDDQSGQWLLRPGLSAEMTIRLK